MINIKVNNKKLHVGICLALFITVFCLTACENYSISDDINEIIYENDISIEMKVRIDSGNYIIERIDSENLEDEYFLQIDVEDTFSLRGEAPITPGNKYKLSVTMKNIDADPLINYSFWKKPITSLRYFTFQGENANPPTSLTQNTTEDWVTYEETFDTLKGEDSLMIVLHCGKGTFLLKQINIEQVE